MIMATVVHQSREDILESIKGQTIRLPDLEKLFDGWPRVINPHENLVADVVTSVFQKYTVSPTLRVKLTKGNIKLFLAAAYPFATAERLSQLAYFLCWMYILDDEIDARAAEGLENSDEQLTLLWAENRRVVGESCGVDVQQSNGQGRKSDLDSDSVEAFREFDRLLTKDYSIEQRQRLWNEFEFMANSYKKEQKIRTLKEVPQYDAYCDYRNGTCCMGPLISTIEYANGSHLSEEIMESPEMKALWQATISVLWMTNDIMSAKKEIGDGFLENLIVIASKPSYRLQDGLNHCFDKLRQATLDLDRAASALSDKYVSGKNDQTAQHVEKFVTNCRSLSVGHFLWSRDSPRFGLINEPRDVNGCMTVKVGEPPVY